MHLTLEDRTARRIRSAGPGVVAAVVLLQTAAHLGNTFGPEMDALDVHAERTVFSALSALTLAALAGLCVLAGRRGPVDLGPARILAGLVATGLRLLMAAVLLEVVSAPFSTPSTQGGLVHAFEGALEEGCELGGWGLLVVGLLTWCTSCVQSLLPTVAADGA